MLRRTACVLSVAAFAAACLAMADDGRIPLSEPTTIVESGSYVVTKDIEAKDAPVLVISEGTIVTVDLNGHTLRRLGSAGAVVLVPILGQQRLTLRNGFVIGGNISTSRFPLVIDGDIPSTLSPIKPRASVPGARLRLENVDLVYGDIHCDPCWGAEITNSRIEGNVDLEGNTGQLVAHLLDSTVGGYVWLGAVGNSVVKGNAIVGDLTLDSTDWSASWNIVEGNTVNGTLRGRSYGTLSNSIRNNVVARGIDLSAGQNHVVGNQVQYGGIKMSGYSSSGGMNIIEENVVTGSVYGLVLTGNNNVYRNNVFHNTSVPVQDNGVGNIDAGGNVK